MLKRKDPLSRLFGWFGEMLSDFADLVDLVASSSVKRSKRKKRTLSQKVLFFPVSILQWLLWITARLLVWPTRILGGMRRVRRREFLASLPAVTGIILIALVTFRVVIGQSEIENKYRSGAELALEKKDYELADTYYSRIVTDDQTANKIDLLNWGVAIANSGDTKRAASLFNMLAPGPDQPPGFPTAHRVLALGMTANLGKQNDAATLRKLKWHLENSGDNESLEISQAWAAYFMSVENYDEALGYLKRAAQIDPRLYSAVATVQKNRGDFDGMNRALNLAVDHFKFLLTKTPEDNEVRVGYARVLLEQKKYGIAERILLKGIEINPEPLIKEATAEFFLIRYDSQSDAQFGQRFEFLKRALDNDMNHVPAYERLVTLYRNHSGNDEAQKLVDHLESVIATGQTAPLAHFALSNILWLQGKNEASQFHMERAFRLDDRFAVIANNLAWLLAHSEVPDLERALDLSSQVVEKVPGDARFRDTLATVLYLQGEYEEALTEFEVALKTIKNTKPVHQKLASIYAKLGRQGLAAKHLRLAQE